MKQTILAGCGPAFLEPLLTDKAKEFDYTEVDLGHLEEQCAKLPGQMAYFGAKFADAELDYAKVRLNQKQVEAQLYNHHRSLLESGSKRTTEAAITAAVTLDPQFAQVQLDLATAEAECTRLKGVMDALRAKRDMLVSICAGRRAEAATYK